MSERLKQALAMAEVGFKVFPLAPNSRRPFLSKPWKEIATHDPDVIEFWFDEYPEINYGVWPGKDYVVIDVDVKEGKEGLTKFLDLEENFEDAEQVSDKTFTVKTTTGGIHYYLQTDEPVSNAHSFPKDIDVRGIGGYVVGPGSEIDGSEYEIVNDTAIIKAPAWVSRNLRKPNEKSEVADESLFTLDMPAAVQRAREFLKNRSPAIEGMGGDNHTYATACQVKDLGISKQQCIGLLLEKDGWNSRCIPKWDSRELAAVVENAYRYGNQPAGAKGGTTLEDYMASQGTEGQDYAEVKRDDRFAHLREITFKGPKILGRNKRREMIIPEWLPAHGLTAFLAKRAGGKTIAMIDAALRIVHDMDWHGLPTEKEWKVVYLCGEDDEGAEEQIRAWCKHHGREFPSERFIFMEGIVDIMSPAETQLWTEYLLEEVIDKDDRVVVVLDTWQRASSKGGQNDDEDMQLAVHHAEAMAQSLNGPVIASFHPPKHDESMVMGSSVIENMTTAIWMMTEHAEGKKLEVTRIKGKGMGNYRIFNWNEIMLNETDQFGRERTGIVPLSVGGTEFYDAQKEISKEEKKRVIVEAIKLFDIHSRSERNKPLDLAMAAEYLTNLTNIALDHGGEFMDLLDNVRNVGIVSEDSKAIREFIKEMFADNGIKTKEGDIIRMDKKDKFKIEIGS